MGHSEVALKRPGNSEHDNAPWDCLSLSLSKFPGQFQSFDPLVGD